MGFLVMAPEYTSPKPSRRPPWSRAARIGCTSGVLPRGSAAEEGDHDPHRNEDGENDGDDLGHGAEPGATKAVHASILFSERGMSPAHKSHSGRVPDWPIGNLPHSANRHE
jgi:hypothetical protein